MSAKKMGPTEFFQKLGNPQLIVAPMVDHSELPYRMLTRKYGAHLVFTQMFNANCMVEAKDYKDMNFTTCPEDRPLIVQFCGNDPDTLLEAARMVEDHCDAVDINLGCPQGIAKRGKYGAFLMEELELLSKIVRTLSTGLKVPVTCKTRIYKNDFQRTIKLCETLVDAGASMLTIHGRTREEKGNLVAQADWEMIAKIKAHFAGRVPVIANGGIENMDDVAKCLEATGADGIMTSEAILENPSMFTRNLDAHQRIRTQLDLAEEYLELTKQYEGASIRAIRSHLMKFLYRYFVKNTDLRVRTAEANTVEGFQEILVALRERVVDENDYTEAWYQRHRNPSHMFAGRTDPRTVVNWQQYTVDQERHRVWDTVDHEADGGMFNGLSMFQEEEGEDEGEGEGGDEGDVDVVMDGEGELIEGGQSEDAIVNNSNINKNRALKSCDYDCGEYED